MKKLLFICALFFAFQGAAQKLPFVKHYSAYLPNLGTFVIESNYSYGVIQTADNGFAFTGVTIISDTAHPVNVDGKMMLHKTDGDGNELWQKEIVLPGNCEDANGYRLREMGNGDLLIASTCHPGLYLIRTDKTGNIIWIRDYSTYHVGFPRMERTNDGGCIVTGSTNVVGGDRGMRLMKFNANGILLWSKLYDIYDPRPKDIKQTPDGGYIVAGQISKIGSGNTWAFVMKTNATGDTLWTKSWNDTSGYGNVEAIIRTSDGGYMASGGVAFTGMLWKLDFAGNIQWQIAAPGTPSYGIHEAPGEAWYSFVFNNYQLALQKISYAGDSILWTKTYTQFVPNYASEMQRTKEGGFIMTGYGSDTALAPGAYANSKAILIKTDGDGNIIFVEPTTIKNKKVQYLSFDVYPNPANDIVSIRCNKTVQAEVTINSLLGQSLASTKLNGNNTALNIAHLPAGLYNIRITDADGEVFISKLLKE